MKALLFFCCLCSGTAATAQTIKKSSPSATQQKVPAPQTPAAGSVTLTQSGSHAAKAVPMKRFTIQDPLIRSYNYANPGSAIFSNGRPMGLPRGTYGFGNGQLYLRSTDATTGSGAVGTGSSAGTVGTAGMSLGVNGKSPYAGPAMWGSANGINIADSVKRQLRSTRAN